MSNIDELLPAAPDPDDGALEPTGWSAIVVGSPESPADTVMVRIPGFDGGEHDHGPCSLAHFHADNLPSDGDVALVVLDDQDEPWIVAWRPAP